MQKKQSDSSHQLSLFPLPMVVFPETRFPLQIFEPRYLDLIKNCLKNDEAFGVVTQLVSTESASAVEESHSQEREGSSDISHWGVSVKVVDFHQQPNGLLGIVCLGINRFEVLAVQQSSSGILVADAQVVACEQSQPVPEELSGLKAVLSMLMEHPYARALGYDDIGYGDMTYLNLDSIESLNTVELGWHLAHLMPISNEQKYQLLMTPSALSRLRQIDQIVQKMQAGSHEI